MTVRLVPWAAMALLVLALAIRSSLPTNVAAVPAGATGPEATGGGPEIRLGPVDVRELNDDGSWNRLEADGAVYAYSDRSVTAGGVTVFLGEGAPFARTTVRAPRAAQQRLGRALHLARAVEVQRHQPGIALVRDLARAAFQHDGAAERPASCQHLVLVLA